MNKLPDTFLERMNGRLKGDFGQFVNAYESDPVLSIRLNPKKKTDAFDKLEMIPWNENGRYLVNKKQFITDPLWHAGAYYVQEASSMVLNEIYNQLFNKQSKPMRGLDLCAAPGGKSTMLQSFLDDTSILVANEVIKSRALILKENHIRLGISENLLITQNDPKDFSQFEELFDFIQVDAPCSGEGMFRKDITALNEWSESNCNLCAERQKRILANIFPALSKDGFMIYSTCTFNPNENEALIDWVCNEFSLESIKLNFKPEYQISEVNYNGVYGYYFYPHKVRGEGLFVSVLKKNSGFGLSSLKRIKEEKSVEISGLTVAENCIFENQILRIERPELRSLKYEIKNRLNVIYSGLEIGELKGENFIPSQALANFHQKLHDFPTLEVDQKTALEFLRGNDPNIDLTQKGIYLLTFEGFGLGWIKFLGNRSNNYYPKPWRIKNY